MEVLVFVALAVIVFVLVYVALKPANETMKINVANITIEVEIADSLLKQMKGLMCRQSLAEDRGMLFIFGSDSYHAIWMLNMNFPIDVIWIDSDRFIVDIARNIPPGIYPVHKPKEKSRYVLEVNAGFADKQDIKIGDAVRL